MFSSHQQLFSCENGKYACCSFINSDRNSKKACRLVATPVECRGWGRAGVSVPPPPPSILVANFFHRVPFDITLQHLFLADQSQIFSIGALGGNITNFERTTLAKPNAFFRQNFPKSNIFGLNRVLTDLINRGVLGKINRST